MDNKNDTLQHLVASLNPGDAQHASWITAHDVTSLFGGTDPSASHSNPPSSTFSLPPPLVSPIRRLPAITRDTRSSTRRSARRPSLSMTPSSAVRQLPEVEKDADDPTTPVDSRLSHHDAYRTPTALTKLLAAQTTISPLSNPSREHSFNAGYEGPLVRPRSHDPTTLPEHLYTRGFLGGRHSDITIIAFGQRFLLHRLILDRTPYFTNGLSEPWIESHQKEVVLHPEEVDSNITKTSFELALKRLYGVDISAEEDAEAVGLFATGCWLEMQDLIDSAIESILRQMAPDNVGGLIRFVTAQYYGRAGERILASAKAMLCRDGWEMPLKFWDLIPAIVVKDVIGGDGFFIPGEWDRWVLAKRLLDRRLRHNAVDVGFLDGFVKTRPRAPGSGPLINLRFNPAMRKAYSGSNDDSIAGVQLERWCSLYTHPEVEPMLSLLEGNIAYMHLDFEQLMLIRQARDVFGLPVLPDRVVMDAQWMQLELRHKVLGARDGDMDLGLSVAIESASEEGSEKDGRAAAASSPSTRSLASPKGKGKQRAVENDEAAPSSQHSRTSSDESRLDTTELAIPKRFYIPSQDCNIVMGGNADPVITTSSSSSQRQSLVSFDDGGLELPNDRPLTPGDRSSSQVPKPQSYTVFPPFRFSAEFPNPRLLKERKRVYSRTVFYAGSLWNVYIQKVRSGAKNPQLGVYLHRAKEREIEDGVISGVGTGATNASAVGGGYSGTMTALDSLGARIDTVDEQIGMLEREMILRSERRERRYTRVRNSISNNHRVQDQAAEVDATRAGDNSSGSGDDNADASGLSNTRRFRPRHTCTRLDAQQSNWSFPQNSSLSSPSTSEYSSADGDDDDDDVFNTYSTMPLAAASASALPNANSLLSARRPRKLIVRSANGNAGTAAGAAMPNSSSARDTVAASAPASASAAAAGGIRRGISRLPTLPPYVDARPTIRTWFKIYSPSKGGRLLSVYESAPDRFNFSQSWGWKSGSLMLDEGFEGAEASFAVVGDEGEGEDGGMLLGGRKRGSRWRAKGEGKLRFMIVIGNL